MKTPTRMCTESFSAAYHIVYANMFVVPEVVVVEGREVGNCKISWEDVVKRGLTKYFVISLVRELYEFRLTTIDFMVIGKIFRESKPFRVNHVTLHPENYAIASVTGQKSDRIIRKWEKKLSDLSDFRVVISWDTVVKNFPKQLGGY